MSFNILIVDDSAAMRSIINKTLRLSGLTLGEIHQAQNGVEALEVLEENWIDLALVDINMPIMDGETLINRVRDNPDTEDLAIIVVSTESSETRIEKLLEKSVQFIHKPFTPETLREKVCNLTGVEYGTSTVSSDDFDF
jgi:two-component system chemotaxis response regulator CheY